MRSSILGAVAIAIGSSAAAQPPTPLEFDVVSIKRVTEVRNSSSFGDRPDGSWVGSNLSIRGFVLQASPIRTREVVGLPDWALTDHYDVTVKGRTGLTDEQRRAMWRAMFDDRMKLAAHIEQRERDVYRLVVARADGRLGPQLTRSSLDCTPRPTAPPKPDAPTRPEDFKGCGYSMNGSAMFSGGLSMERLALALDGVVDADVEDQTGLSGYYTLTLKYSSRLRDAGAAAGGPVTDDAPDIFTAVQEQLGLKLVRGKKMMPVFVIDHIERPTEN
jgi:uncharacterized protein (TIGR03435 family)